MDFVKEGKLDEEKKRKQAEWERVRSKEDPIEAPPEVFDSRTLYEKLKEQNDIKKKEFEDKYALKNQMRGIDDDEAYFLNEIDMLKSKRDRELRLEERKEVEEVKNITEIAAVPKISCTLPTNRKEKKQSDLLKSAIVSKRKISAVSSANALMNNLDESFEKVISAKKSSKDENEEKDESDSDTDEEIDSKKSKKASNLPNSQIVIGVLPGLGEYNTDSSSLSDESSEDEEDDVVFNRNKDIDCSAASKLSK